MASEIVDQSGPRDSLARVSPHRLIFEELRRPLDLDDMDERIAVDDEGVWIVSDWTKFSRALRTEFEEMRPENRDDLLWHPAMELDEGEGPPTYSTPALPFPFTAEQLAAFMVAGWGYNFPEEYGDLVAGADPAKLEILGRGGAAARAALLAAYSAFHKACAQLGEPLGPRLRRRYQTLALWCTLPADERAARCRRAGWAVHSLIRRRDEARLTWHADESRWRKAIVKSLIGTSAGPEVSPNLGSNGLRDELAWKVGTELPADRRRRRLDAFHASGGAMRPAGDGRSNTTSDRGWQQSGRRGALEELARSEREAGRPMSHRTDVRDDLVAELEARAARGETEVHLRS